MALKGQKFIRFTDEERTEIVGKYLSGKYSYATLADEYGISWNTIHTMVRKYRNKGTTISAQKGRSKEKDLTREDYKERYEKLKNVNVKLFCRFLVKINVGFW